MTPARPLTAEELRILTAAYEGRICQDESGRWMILGGDLKRPARRARKHLQNRELITCLASDCYRLRTTPTGAAVLAASRA